MRNFDFETLKHYKFYQFARSVARPVLRVGYRIKYKGLENIPQGGGYILAVNHTSALDPALVALPRQLPPLHFMAKEELFYNALAAWLITHLYAFPVRRGKGDRSSINRSVKILESGHVLAICPEGKRNKDKGGVPQNAKAGIALIAAATGADILPVAIHCRGGIKLFRRVTVSYGKLIPNSDLHMDEGKKSEIRRAAGLVMDQIKALWEAENCR